MQYGSCYVDILLLTGQGRPQDLAGGGAKKFFVRGIWGHAPLRNFFKMVQFGTFWRIF